MPALAITSERAECRGDHEIPAASSRHDMAIATSNPSRHLSARMYGDGGVRAACSHQVSGIFARSAPGRDILDDCGNASASTQICMAGVRPDSSWFSLYGV